MTFVEAADFQAPSQLCRFRVFGGGVLGFAFLMSPSCPEWLWPTLRLRTTSVWHPPVDIPCVFGVRWVPELESVQGWGWGEPGRQVWGRGSRDTLWARRGRACPVRCGVASAELGERTMWVLGMTGRPGKVEGTSMYLTAGGLSWGVDFWQPWWRDLSIQLSPRVWQWGELKWVKVCGRGLASTRGAAQWEAGPQSHLGNRVKTQISELEPIPLHAF